MVNIGNSWDDILKDEWQKEYYVNLRKKLIDEYRNYTVYPHMNHLFEALKLTPLENVKVVILGQDPYHGPGQAHGLSFSVNKGVRIPPSLKNIYAEIKEDLGYDIPSHGNLTYWAEQGVLLLNSSLSVRRGSAGSHRDIGWHNLTKRILEEVSKKKEHVVFLIWGSHAKSCIKDLDLKGKTVLTTVHPSPLSAYRGFFGCRHFSKTNEILRKYYGSEIDWRIK